MFEGIYQILDILDLVTLDKVTVNFSIKII